MNQKISLLFDACGIEVFVCLYLAKGRNDI